MMRHRCHSWMPLLLIPLILAACRAAVETVETVETPTPAATLVQGPLYLDPGLPATTRAADLLARMTLAEKIGQMTLVEKNSIDPKDITEKFIGALLSGGGGSPRDNTPESWLEMVNEFQEYALETRLGIPLIYGIDAVHGHNNVKGATIFPHNVGLGATRNPDLVEQIGRATAEEMVATGIYWNYAPVVAVVQDIRWGRSYESYGEEPELVSLLATAYLRGLQGEHLRDPAMVLATPKHYVADGGTAWGSSKTQGYRIDQGDAQVDEATLRAVHLSPYEATVSEGALSVMVSFSSWAGQKMHGHRYLLTDVLKEELGFSGFLVSDWEGIDQVDPNYYTAVVTSINAGVDMNMVPYEYERFIQTLTEAVEKGDVAEARIDDAVRRILTVKFELGLFEQPLTDADALGQVGSSTHRELARQAVRESLVLLKNEGNSLPIAKDTPRIFVAGEAADDIGIQSGGWTIEWQGKTGNITSGTTILDAIEGAASASTSIHYNRFGKFDQVTDESGAPILADVGIAVLGERPYAEGRGDSNDLSLSGAEIAALDRLRERSERVILILVSGRPLIITEQLPLADAIVAAWLPGTEGQGVTDVLFGDYPFTGTLPFSWPRAMDQLPFDIARLVTEGCEAPLFPFGYGLDTQDGQPFEPASCP